MENSIEQSKITGYRELAARFRNQIMSGALASGSRLDSVRAIAGSQGLSVTTVCRAIDLLEKEGLVRRVERSGVFVGGREDVAEKKLKQIGVITASAPGFVASQMYREIIIPAVQRSILKRGCRFGMHYCWYRPNDESGLEYVPAVEFADSGLDGMFLLGIYDHHYLSDMARLKAPMVAYDIDASYLGIDSVFVDNTRGSFELTRHLIEQGHTSIVYVGGPGPGLYGDIHHGFDPSAVERATGYRLAMQMLAPDLTPRVYHASRERTSKGFVGAVERALREVPDCTAMVTEGGGGHPEIKKRNIHLAYFRPERVETFPDDTTAIAVCDFVKMAERSAELLAKRMDDPFRPVERCAIPAEIVTQQNS